MNNKLIKLDVPTFKIQLSAFLQSLQDRVVAKSDEYSRGGDAFSNFNAAAELKDVDPRIVLDWYMTKHLISYQDFMQDINVGYFGPDDKTSEEKLGDIIVYLGILHIMNCTKNSQTEELPF